MYRLTTESVKAKHSLNNLPSTTIEVAGLMNGHDFKCSLTNEKLTELCKKHFDKIRPAIKDLITQAK